MAPILKRVAKSGQDMFVEFVTTPSTWRCYSEVGNRCHGKATAQRTVIIFATQKRQSWIDGCSIDCDGAKLDPRLLPVRLHIVASDPIDPPDAAEFHPCNIPENAVLYDFEQDETPSAIYGTVGFHRDDRSEKKEGGICVDLNLSDSTFDELWHGLISRGKVPKLISIDAFGSALEYRGKGESELSSLNLRGEREVIRHGSVDWLWHAERLLFVSRAVIEYGFGETPDLWR